MAVLGSARFVLNILWFLIMFVCTIIATIFDLEKLEHFNRKSWINLGISLLISLGLCASGV